MFNIVLLEPEIPANTGNIGRTCLITGSRLHLIEPMGFILNDKYLKRAGMDYWPEVDVTVYDSWRDFVWKNADRIEFPPETLRDVHYPGIVGVNTCDRGFCGVSSYGEDSADRTGNKTGARISEPGRKATIWMASTKGPVTHDSAAFQDGDFIMFGKESRGIPEKILRDNYDTTIRIPMHHSQRDRSLNLSNSAAIVLYEALRQNHYLDLELEGHLRS